MRGAIYVFATLVTVAWPLSAILFRITRHKAFHAHVFHELRPLFLPATVVELVIEASTGLPLWTLLSDAAFQAMIWWLFHDADKSDRWKRRRRKARQAIARLGARLIVVPVATEPAP